jgi:hypothetical protein
LLIEMEPEFLVEFALDGTRPQQRAQAMTKLAPEGSHRLT